MTIPDYFQEINNFDSPLGHPNEADFMAEGLTEIDPTTGSLKWNAAGQAIINEMISTRFSLAVELYHFIRELESKLPESQMSRQVVARGYYAMFWAGRALSLTLCNRDWGMGTGNHGNLATHLEIHTRTDRWYPKFHQFLIDWRPLRNCADYNIFPVLVYSGRHAGRRPRKVGPAYDSLDRAARDVGNFVEDYLQESRRLIISSLRGTTRGVHLVSIS